ncbi:FAD:protein FMN transferase [Flagellimonas myxillae]|uniref:FAD:protein FMN transferase n=1 Tax=Flagellimonas myxillae TaxID=2942214 RepID=UPI00201F2250|nr:FAD:protein FMN transferase [Muricauda myxillae]MCL6265727.1 FAD:protein FMN transferase [Muricauda myxillae]
MKRFRRRHKLMGCSFELGVVADSESEAMRILEDGIREIQRIEHLLTEFREDSTISKINLNAGIKPVEVEPEVLQLLHRSQQISNLSDGYFDITMGALKQLYQFKNKEVAFPNKKRISNTLKHVGYSHLQLDAKNNTALLTQKEMRISLAAIGKGYAADVVRQKWKNYEIPGGYIDASGDLTAFGTDEKGEAWKIGIANPDNQDQTLFHIPLNHASVATSGDYEQHFMFQGIRYSHNINPKTGFPVTGVKSVSVFSPSAELSDALATAVYSMGPQKGMSFLNQLPHTHGIIVNAQNKVFFSKQLQYEAVPS